MIINYLHKIGWFVGLVLLQVLILNNVHIAGYATPFLYIYLNLSFFEILGCQCLGASRDAAYS